MHSVGMVAMGRLLLVLGLDVHYGKDLGEDIGHLNLSLNSENQLHHPNDI